MIDPGWESDLSAKKQQRFGKSVAITVECPEESCSGTAAGRLSVPGGSSVRAATSFKLRRVGFQLARGETAKLKLRPRGCQRNSGLVQFSFSRRLSSTRKPIVATPQPRPPERERKRRLEWSADPVFDEMAERLLTAAGREGEPVYGSRDRDDVDPPQGVLAERGGLRHPHPFDTGGGGVRKPELPR